jgi:hypothetical protein
MNIVSKPSDFLDDLSKKPEVEEEAESTNLEEESVEVVSNESAFDFSF